MQWNDATGNTGLLQEILRSLQQPTTDTGHWPFSDLLRRANAVMREICEQSECLKSTDTSNTSVSGTSVYNLPSGCTRVTRVAYGDDRISGINTAELDMNSLINGQAWQSLPGTPQRYINDDTSIKIVPIPNDTGTTITIEYIAQPTELVNNTDIPFNAKTNLYSFHDIIAAGVVYRCMLEQKNQFYTEWKSIYSKGIERLKEFVSNMPDTMMTMQMIGGARGRDIGAVPGLRRY